mmetsp:Transcript_10074/g.15062  ORF Transcript_10074/g.15062 Transcript_10074/m.15062 type:complete len:165 (+) Transcript_10074:55-549(+)
MFLIMESRTSKRRSRSPERPNFTPSGILKRYEDAQLALKYTEPLESAPPSYQWRVFVYQDEDLVSEFDLFEKNYYLVGSTEGICNITEEGTEGQHAVFQFRRRHGKVRLYLIDLETQTGTFLNYKRIESSRFYEVISKDIVKFGDCGKEYVLIKGKKLKSRSPN